MAVKQTPQVPPAEKVQASYKQLSLAATNLNTASDGLGKAISVWDAALQKLNLGITAWVEVSGNDHCSPDGAHWWSRDIGYAKTNDKWGIALRTAEGDHRDDGYDSVEVWSFNEAPRWMRIEAVGKLPDLLEALLRQTESTTKKILDKTAQAYELAAAMNEAGADKAILVEQVAASATAFEQIDREFKGIDLGAAATALNSSNIAAMCLDINAAAITNSLVAAVEKGSPSLEGVTPTTSGAPRPSKSTARK